MQGFQHKYGDQPLEGYTIQRAVGRGGFGEVYYALSDSGREVALKALQGYEQIELRGVTQCMNLKSPHLVTIFDIRHNEQDRPFVIMEYVAGPSLRELLNDSPSGLGVQKAAFFLREIAKGLTFLHDRGIVHRDLKPGNIFYEDGYVKIGDYGLSKAISASQHSAQTITVGTVHYMAPEIGQGRYDRGIDVYALGVLLYEMLTGHVPFFGASHGEILMKHLTNEPDCSGIEEPFAAVIRKAMAKEPDDRYASAQEMVEAVFGAEHIQQSVSHFSPESLSMVAERVSKKVAVGGTGSSAEHAGQLDAGRPPEGGSSDVWQDFAHRMDEFGTRMTALGERFGRGVGHVRTRLGHRLSRHRHVPGTDAAHPRHDVLADASRDPLHQHQRRRLFALTAIAVGIGTGMLGAAGDLSPVEAVLFAPLMILGAGWGILSARRRFLAKVRPETGAGVVDHIAFGGAACLGGLLLSAPVVLGYGVHRYSEVLLSLIIAMFLMDWNGRTCPGRDERVDLGEAITAGLLGWILSWFFDADSVLLIGTLAGTSLAVQAASPWDPEAAKRRKEQKKAAKAAAAAGSASPSTEAAGGTDRSPGDAAAAPTAPPSHARHVRHVEPSPSREKLRLMPPWVRAIALLVGLILLGIGLVLVIWAGLNDPQTLYTKYSARYSSARYNFYQHRPTSEFIWHQAQEEFILTLSFGIASLLLSLFAFVKALRSTFRSWWGDMVKPILLLLCVESILVASFYMGNVDLGSDEQLAALFFIIFPGILLLVILFIPNRAVQAVFGRALAKAKAVGKSGNTDDRVSPAGEASPAQGQANLTGERKRELAATLAGSLPTASSVLRGSTVAIEKATSFILALVVALLMLAAFAAGLAAAVNLPLIVAAGLPDPQIAEEITHEFGDASWPWLFRKILVAQAGLLVLLASGLWIAIRRRAGGAHMMRVVLGASGLAATLAALRYALDRIDWWKIGALVNGEQPGPAVEVFLDRVDNQSAVLAGILLLVSIILLAWPPRRSDSPTFPASREGA